MKTTRFFAAALTLLSVLSCQKEEQQTIGNSENEVGVIITCTFAKNDAATRTTVDTDGKTPLWCAGDKIMLYDGSSNAQELTLAASGTASSSTGIINGTDATKFTFVRPSGWTNVYAIYPYSACVSGFSASAPKINFAGQDGTFAKANICAAVESAGTMSFKNVGAILKFTSKPAKVMNILVPSAEMQNDYSVTFTGGTPNLTSVSASHIPEVDLGNGTGVVYIGVPAGTIAASSVFKYRSASRGVFKIYTTSSANTLERNKIYSLGDITLGGEPDLSFSVSADRKVYFSKGNLYCNTSASPVTFSFEENQCDYRNCNFAGWSGDAAVIGCSKTTTPANTVGSFYFNSTVSYAYDSYFNYADAMTDILFTNDQTTETNPNAGLTIDGFTGLWRSMTNDEWSYLLTSRTVNGGSGENHSYKRTTITLADGTTTVFGLIIIPDGYSGALPATTVWSDWLAMESAGCVFLPAAGCRADGNNWDSKKVNSAGSEGWYRTSTPHAGTPIRVKFKSDEALSVGGNYRYVGMSLRLVSTIN